MIKNICWALFLRSLTLSYPSRGALFLCASAGSVMLDLSSFPNYKIEESSPWEPYLDIVS